MLKRAACEFVYQKLVYTDACYVRYFHGEAVDLQPVKMSWYLRGETEVAQQAPANDDDSEEKFP